jgi:hypothetical protein
MLALPWIRGVIGHCALHRENIPVQSALLVSGGSMSSPTINIGQGSGDTSLETIMNLVRALVNDSQAGETGTPGEGQIITDNPAVSPFTQPFLNSAIREVYRELRNAGQPTLIKDNVQVLGLTPLVSPTLGAGAPDPAVQVSLGFEGYFNGLELNADLKLPSDVITLERVWERQTSSSGSYIPMDQPQFGLPSLLQGARFQVWEWREDKIWMIGATQTNDLRLRYWAALPQFFSSTLDFASTFVPIIDCTDAVAYKTAAKYAASLGAPGAAALVDMAKEQMFQLKMQHVRRSQSINYERIPYGSYGNGGSTTGAYNIGWQ